MEKKVVAGWPPPGVGSLQSPRACELDGERVLHCKGERGPGNEGQTKVGIARGGGRGVRHGTFTEDPGAQARVAATAWGGLKGNRVVLVSHQCLVDPPGWKLVGGREIVFTHNNGFQNQTLALLPRMPNAGYSQAERIYQKQLWSAVRGVSSKSEQQTHSAES